MQHLNLIATCFLSLLLSMVGNQGRADPTVVTIPAFTNYLPFSGFNDEQGFHGFYIDLARRLVSTPDDRYSIDFMEGPTWERSLRAIELGQLSVLYEVSYREDRTAYLDYVGTMGVERAFLVAPEALQVDEIATLDDFYSLELEVGIRPSFSWDEKFNERLETDPAFRANFVDLPAAGDTGQVPLVRGRMISAGRIGAMIFNEIDAPQVVQYGNIAAANDSRFQRIKAIPITAFGEPVVYVAVSKQLDQKTRNLIRQNYQESRIDGSFDQIWYKWNPKIASPPNVTP